MKNDMNLIMESWRSNSLNESEGEKTAQELLSKLSNFIKKNPEQFKKVKDGKNEINEDFGVTAFATWTLAKIVIPYVIQLVSTLALGAALSKFANALQKKFTGQDMNFLNSMGELMNFASEFLATFGFVKGGLFLLKRIPNLDRRTRRKWKTRLQLTEKVVLFAIVIYSLHYEIYKQADKAGGVGNLINSLATKAGLDSNFIPNSELVNLFTTSVDTVEQVGQATEITIDRGAFWADLQRQIRRAWG